LYNYTEKRDSDLGNIPQPSRKNWEKPRNTSVWIIGIQLEIRNWSIPCINLESQPLVHIASYNSSNLHDVITKSTMGIEYILIECIPWEKLPILF